MREAMSDNFMSTLKLLEQVDKKYKSFLCQHSTNSMSTWLDHDVLHWYDIDLCSKLFLLLLLVLFSFCSHLLVDSY